METIRIDSDAGIIWQVINDNKDIKITDLKKLTKMEIKNIYLALGWLARENKVFFF
ncbi:MAG: winged helix-turn-helix domain-containing protein [Prolixibacteraceae bacterium]|nr:winged helix-turn-helix domain-containing protein [Prolixibacteraceae bacterium]